MTDEAPARTSSRVARQGLIIALMQQREVGSQAELADLLAGEGITVSQGTLSKDLWEIGAVRVRSADGSLVYALPNAEVASDHAAHEARLARIWGCSRRLRGRRSTSRPPSTGWRTPPSWAPSPGMTPSW